MSQRGNGKRRAAPDALDASRQSPRRAASDDDEVIILSPPSHRVGAASSSDAPPDEECLIVAPPKAQPILAPPPLSRKSPDGAGGEDTDDDEVQCVGVRRAKNPWPHARHDCNEHPLSDSLAAQHCEHCWCALCGVPVAKCDDWSKHCGTTAAEAQEHRAAKRQVEVEHKLKGLGPKPPPPAPHSTEAQLMADPRWRAMRFTAISYLLHCGHDLEGYQQAVVSVCASSSISLHALPAAACLHALPAAACLRPSPTHSVPLHHSVTRASPIS